MQIYNIINYKINDSKSYRGEGNIQDIKTKTLNRLFKLYSDLQNQFSIDLSFEAPSIVTEISMRFIGTHHLELQLIDAKNQLIEKIQKTIGNKDEEILIKLNLLQPVQYVKLKIEKNSFSQRKLGIRYILFKGINDEVEKKSQDKNSNSKKNHKIEEYFEKRINPRKDPRSIETKEIFKSRQKEKGIKEEVQKLIDFTDFQNEYNYSKEKQERDRVSLQKSEQKLTRKVKQNEDDFLTLSKKSYAKQKLQKQKQKEETELAIALSRLEQKIQDQNLDNHMNIDSNTMKMDEEEPLPAGLENYINQKLNESQIQEEHERIYQTMEFNEDYLEFFSNMSPQWLQIQRKAEIEHNVRDEERLSNFIRIKWLNNTQIYIQGFQDWKIDELQHQAKLLGCKIIDELKNNCIAIVPKPVGQKLKKKHKQWKEVKYLNENYLEHCIAKQQKLSFRGYYLNV